MSIYNSINTNRQAVFAMQTLNFNTTELNGVQKRVSTGFRVADSRDDTGAFSVAQAVRSDIAGVTAVNEQLGGARGILATTLSALGEVSNTMQQIRTVLTRLGDSNVTGDSRLQYQEQFNSLVLQTRNFLTDATYNGRSLMPTTGTVGGSISGIRNESGAQYTIAGVAASTLVIGGTMSGPVVVPTTSAEAIGYFSGAISSTGTNLFSVENRINNALASFGASAKFVDNQVAFNTKRIDALTDGLGALVDADLAKESSRMTALQTRQELSLQTLSMANQTPQKLLSLFR
jgi:flagellin